jgi:phospholipid/cholesterol/gamma-HCH transport system substrate-binding protein
MKKYTKEVKIGIMTLISLVLLYVGLNYLKGIDLFKAANRYFVAFDNVEGLTISSPVYVEGFKVGLVRSMSYDYQDNKKILVELRLNDAMRIQKGSYVELVKSLLGGAELQIHLNKYTDKYVASDAVLEGRPAPDMVSSVEQNVLPTLTQMLPRIDSILIGLQALVNDPALSQSLKNVQGTTANLEASSKQLNRLLSRDVPHILGDLGQVSKNFSSVSEQLKGLDIQGTMRSIQATVDNLKTTTEQFHSKDNSLGLLLNDKSLYDNLNGTAVNASKLLLDLRQNPKRYVHFSLF